MCVGDDIMIGSHKKNGDKEMNKIQFSELKQQIRNIEERICYAQFSGNNKLVLELEDSLNPLRRALLEMDQARYMYTI